MRLVRAAGLLLAAGLLQAPASPAGRDVPPPEAAEFILCGAPCAGCCGELNGTPACNDGTCCELVCDLAPWCCDFNWDADCAEIALDSCALGMCDCNGNGVDDGQDIAGGTSFDLNGNGIPDECEDCNGNGIGDCEDLSGGGSADCNGNGVPDECESGADCNENGIQDLCDLAAGTSGDCNRNGVPDECDIAGGLDEDCNANVVPDRCEILCGVDIVFVLDTSGSMSNDQPELCDELISGLGAALPEMVPGDVRVTILGITDLWNAPCAEGTVAQEIGTVVPGDSESCPGPPGSEDWGPAVAIVAEGFGWNEGAVQAVVPVSDEGPCRGEPCEDPGPDRDAVDNAISVANDHGVVGIAVSGLGAGGCVIDLVIALAADTNGAAFHRGGATTYAQIADLLAGEIAPRLAGCNDFNGNLVPDDCEVPGDLDGDGTVGVLDFLQLLGAWGPCPGPCPPSCMEDLNDDCNVGVNDLLIMLANWG
jgi:hypothetical protein